MPENINCTLGSCFWYISITEAALLSVLDIRTLLSVQIGLVFCIRTIKDVRINLVQTTNQAEGVSVSILRSLCTFNFDCR